MGFNAASRFKILYTIPHYHQENSKAFGVIFVIDYPLCLDVTQLNK